MKRFLLFLAPILLLVFVTRYSLRFTHAGSGDMVSGWAWADTAGWISFNCTNVAGECDRSNYGVTVDPDTGKFSGYAWSDNVGWVSFTRNAIMGTPPAAPFNGAEDYSALWNKTTNAVTGWAKILSMGSSGWLQFRSASLDPATAHINGWMWNGNTDGTGIGWVELRNIVRSALPNTKPNTPTAIKPKDNIDIGTLDSPMTVSGVTFTWSNFSDANPGDTQQAYEIQVEPIIGTLGTGTSTNCSIMNMRLTCVIPNSGSSFAYGLSYPTLSYDTEYQWRVRVQDNHGEWSDIWPAFASFRTPKHALPITQFSTTEISRNDGDAVQFTDTSQIFDGKTEETLFVWDFGDGTKSTDRNPTHMYSVPKEYTVCLRATDSDRYFDTRCMKVNPAIKSALPVWRRIIPF